MQSFTLETYPTRGQIHILFYKNVSNAADLRKRLLSHDQELSYAFIDAKVVLDKFQLLIATNDAVHHELNSSLITHNIHSEIVYNLSPTTNISESLRRFGIADSSTSIAVVKVGGNSEEVKSHLSTLIHGEESDIKDFSSFADISKIKKYYKIDDKINDQNEILDMIVGSIAVKSVNCFAFYNLRTCKMQAMDQEMDEYKTPMSSRNSTQNMILEDEMSIMTRSNTQQTDQDMDEYRNETLFCSQQTDQETIENYEDNKEEMINENPPEKRKRTTKKKDGIQDNETSITVNKRTRPTTRKDSTPKTKSKKKSASQTISDTEPPKEIISETSTSENGQTKKSAGRNLWSLEDDKKLIDAVLMNLQDVPWSKIARENFSNRDRSGCYNRWNVIKKRLYQDINGN
ncbi:CGI-121-domain-containing protein [Rhizophagus clarus]|uniref:EKC/KEOPS complex subunit CGI121 n=2 Tax=Rhizophagus clarus TaxID=94130 RepID=A0A8H3L5X8_9GLOM|nr:CGI-121-domain-containing protein [Rhizophagus clarus]